VHVSHFQSLQKNLTHYAGRSLAMSVCAHACESGLRLVHVAAEA